MNVSNRVNTQGAVLERTLIYRRNDFRDAVEIMRFSGCTEVRAQPKLTSVVIKIGVQHNLNSPIFRNVMILQLFFSLGIFQSCIQYILLHRLCISAMSILLHYPSHPSFILTTNVRPCVTRNPSPTHICPCIVKIGPLDLQK